MRASCRKRAGTVLPTAENLGLITADHIILSEESESRCGRTRSGNSVVTIPPMQNKNFSGDPEEPNEVLGVDEETKSHFH